MDMQNKFRLFERSVSINNVELFKLLYHDIYRYITVYPMIRLGPVERRVFLNRKLRPDIVSYIMNYDPDIALEMPSRLTIELKQD